MMSLDRLLSDAEADVKLANLSGINADQASAAALRSIAASLLVIAKTQLSISRIKE